MATIKTYNCEVKAVLGPNKEDQGIIEYYASTFDKTPDRMGDIMDRHSFDKTLAQMKTIGAPHPVGFAHAMVGDNVFADPFNIIGSADPNDIEVDDYGIKVKAQLDIETNPNAAQVYSLVKRGIVRGASFGYNVKSETRQRDRSNLIKEVELFESGPCVVGVNSGAGVVAVKADGLLVIEEPETETEIDHETTSDLQAAHDALVHAGAKCAVVSLKTDDTVEESVVETKTLTDEDVLMRLRLMELDL